MLGLLIGLSELKKIGISQACVEGDSKVVIEWRMGSWMGYWKYASFVHEIRDLVASLNISFSQVPRSQNSLVDKVAKWGVNLDVLYFSNVMPDCLN